MDHPKPESDTGLQIGAPFSVTEAQFDWSGLLSGFQQEHPSPPVCAACGKPIAGEELDGQPEVPLWLWKNGNKLSIAFHFDCGLPRIIEDRSRAFPA
jgi:hypothetical protein